MDPLIVGKELRQSGRRANLCPCQRCARRQHRGDLRLKVIIVHHPLGRSVPPRTATFRADPRLFIGRAAGNPFVTAPLAAVTHDGDRNPTHGLSPLPLI